MEDFIKIVNILGTPIAAMVVMGAVMKTLWTWARPKLDAAFEAHMALIRSLQKMVENDSRLLQEIHDDMVRRRSNAGHGG